MCSASDGPEWWRGRVASSGVAAVVCTGGALLVWALIRRDFGMSWDEPFHLAYAEAIVEYFRRGWDGSAIAGFPVENLRWYSHVGDVAAVFVAGTAGLDVVEVRHALTGLYWVGTFAPVCLLAGRIAGSSAAWLAGLALFGQPAYLGQGFINSKDVPLAMALAWLLWIAVWCADRRRRAGVQIAAFAVGLSLLLTARPGAWFFGVFVLVPLLVELGWRQPAGAARGRVVLWHVGCAGAALAIAWGVMVLPWPYAHENPFWHPVEAMRYASRFDWVYEVLYRGVVHPSDALPWHYYFVYFGLTTPLPILAAALGGHLVVAARTRSGSYPAARDPVAGVAAGCLAFALWFPLLAFVVLRPNVYDGIRHFLFILPVLAVWAGIGLAALAACGCATGFAGRRARLAVAVVLALTAVPAAVLLHPYAYVYFNGLAGDRRSLHTRFDTDFWATSFREAAQWLGAHTNGNQTVQVALPPLPSLVFVRYAPARLVAVPDDPERSRHGDQRVRPAVDWVVLPARTLQVARYPAEPIAHEIRRDGILLCRVRRRGDGP